jgi:hypothetical protein
MRPPARPVPTRATPRRGAGALAALGLPLAFSGCWHDDPGHASPPTEFGGVASRYSCAAAQGVYRWPPVAGEFAGGKVPSNRIPWDGGPPIPIHGREVQIWLREVHGEMDFHWREVNRDGDGRVQLGRDWGFNLYDEFRCEHGRLVFAARDLGHDDRYGGEGIRRGFTVVPLSDGGLAVGIKTVAYKVKGSLFSYEGSSIGDYETDVTYWTWSKLARTGDGATEPAADASSVGP